MIAWIRRLIVSENQRRDDEMLTNEKNDFIVAYTWIFGCTKKRAATIYREEKAKKNTSFIQSVITCFQNNAKRAFYSD